MLTAPLRRGQANADVLVAQQRLAELYFYSGHLDAEFGSETETAVPQLYFARRTHG